MMSTIMEKLSSTKICVMKHRTSRTGGPCVDDSVFPIRRNPIHQN